jgi:hypothetical protein
MKIRKLIEGNAKFPRLADTARKVRIYLFSEACPIQNEVVSDDVDRLAGEIRETAMIRVRNLGHNACRR